MKENKREIKENKKKTWLELTSDEIKQLSCKTACMYGKKSKSSVSLF